MKLNKKQVALINKWAKIDALGEHLSDWPENTSYKKVLKMIHKVHEDVVVNELYEYYLPEDLIQKIEELRLFNIKNYVNLYFALKEVE